MQSVNIWVPPPEESAWWKDAKSKLIIFAQYANLKYAYPSRVQQVGYVGLFKWCLQGHVGTLGLHIELWGSGGTGMFLLGLVPSEQLLEPMKKSEVTLKSGGRVPAPQGAGRLYDIIPKSIFHTFCPDFNRLTTPPHGAASKYTTRPQRFRSIASYFIFHKRVEYLQM